ncbi:alpha/beta fold hydrolase [Halorussus sp. AFM4]|uniref:alpha/beta fold hydrolase n=1 Tax=Halorussus sp. AFM4 TaxID=3421651 RepID=UPI003EBE3913
MTNPDDWADAQETESVSVDGNELEMAYYDEGEGDPVVLLHGIPTWSFLWRDVADALSDERRVIVPDMVGYGNSSMRDEFDRSIRAQEQAVADLLDGLGLDTVSFVGHDLGGGVGLRYAVHRPDAVDRLVLSNAVAYDAWPVEPIVNLGLPSTAKEKSVGDVQELLDGMFRESLASDDPSDEFVEGMKAPWNSEEGVVSLVRNAAATNTNHTTEIDPSEVTADTLLLWGADDEFQPISSAERLDGDIESSRVVGIDGANHWVVEDSPDRYTEELRQFLLAEEAE